MGTLRLKGATSGYEEIKTADIGDNNTYQVGSTVTAVNVTASGDVTAVDVTASGDISDSVSNLRTPRRTAISADTTVSNEGVYNTTNAPTITLGAPSDGAIMTFYNNNASSMTLQRGSTVTNMRIAADNTTTNKTSVTLGAYSTTTVTMFTSTFAIVTGTDVA